MRQQRRHGELGREERLRSGRRPTRTFAATGSVTLDGALHRGSWTGTLPDVLTLSADGIKLAGERVNVVDALERLRADRPHLVEAVVLGDLMGMATARSRSVSDCRSAP